MAYPVPDAPDFTVVAHPGVWNGPSYTLRSPDDTIVATLVKEDSGWHTVMGEYLPHRVDQPLTVLPPKPGGPDNFHHAVLNALRVRAEDADQPLPGSSTYADVFSVAWAFTDLAPFDSALRTAARRIWPLSHEDRPALTQVLQALDQLKPHNEIQLENDQIRGKADAIEGLAPAVRALRTQLETENLRTSDLYGLVRVLSGHAHEMPARLRTFADSRTTPQPAAAPTREAAAPIPEAATMTPAADGAAPVTEGGAWDPHYPVPETVAQLWTTAQAQGWTMTRSTDASFASQRLNVELEAHTVVGHWRFTLEWQADQGKFAANKQGSSALWPDGRSERRPTIADALNAMQRYPAVPAPVEDEADTPGERAVAADPTADDPEEAAQQVPAEEPGAAAEPDENPSMPFDAQEVRGMPGYWWRLEPRRGSSRDDVERITVGYGTEQIGDGYGPHRGDGAVKWRITVGTDSMPGERTPSASARKIAERHQALQEAALLTGPRPAETVWIHHERDHGEETRTYAFGVAENDKDALAALEAEDFTRMPSAGAWVQRKGTRPDTRAYKTGLFVRRMLKHGRSIAVHYNRDGAPADTTLPEIDDARRGELDSFTQDERRDWSPIEFQAGDQVLLKGSQSWWHTVTDVKPRQLTVELKTADYGDVLARRRGEDVLTAADPVGDLTAARPGTHTLRGVSPEILEAEQARLDLPLADPAHAGFVEARRAEIATERERVSGSLARTEKRRARLQAVLTNPKALKEHGGKLLANEWGEPLGAVVKKEHLENLPRMHSALKFFLIDLDGNPRRPLERKGDAQAEAIRREDRLHRAAPAGWRRTAWSQVEPGTIVRLPEAGQEETTPESWSEPFTLTATHRGSDGSLTIEGTREGQTIHRELDRDEALDGPVREATGQWAIRPETIVARAARPALLEALKHTHNNVLMPGSGRELADAQGAIRTAEKALYQRPTPIARLREQITAAAAAATRLAADAERTGWPEIASRAQAALDVAHHWAEAFEDVETAARQLQEIAGPAPVPAHESTAPAPASDSQSTEQAPVGRPWPEMRPEDFGLGATPAAPENQDVLAEGQMDLGSSSITPTDSAVEAAQEGQTASADDSVETAAPDNPAPVTEGEYEPVEWSSLRGTWDALRLDGEDTARALVARATIGDLAADGQLVRAPVQVDGEIIGSVVTRPGGGYAATTVGNWTTKHPFETVAGAVAQVVQYYDEWEATRDEREARRRELGLDLQTPANPQGELPEDATPVPGHPDYHQASAYPGTVVYGPGNLKIGSVENRTHAQGKHRTLYGDNPIKPHDTIERSIRHLVEVHTELHDVPDNKSWLNVWIEHHRDHTYVWGAAHQYRELVFALEVAGGPQGFNRRNVDGAHRQHGMYWHALPKNLTYAKRTEKVNALLALMVARGREIPVFESLEAKQAAAEGVTVPVGNHALRLVPVPDMEPGETFNTTAELQKLLGGIKQLHNSGLRYNTVWQRMSDVTREDRPDVRRLNAAIALVRDAELFTVPQPLALARTIELARVARMVAERLRGENAPALHGHVEDLAALAEQLAERTIATAARPSTWPAVFKTPMADDTALGAYQRARAQAQGHWWTIISAGFNTGADGDVAAAALALDRIMLSDQLPEKASSVEAAAQALTALHGAATALQDALAAHPELSHPQIEEAVAAIADAASSNLPPDPATGQDEAPAPVLSLDSTPAAPAAADAVAPVVGPQAAADEPEDVPALAPAAVLTESAVVPVADPEAGQRWEESNPRPSQRLAVFRDEALHTNVIVTGTEPGEGDAELREWLKSQHFSYQGEGRWESNHDSWRNHPRTGLIASRLEKTARTRIQALDTVWQQTRDRLGKALTLELRAQYEHKAQQAEDYPLTAQQRAIIVAAQNGLNVAVQALAGTGKTSTMVALARRMLNRRITYLAFNSANAEDARKKFAGLRHVSVSTAHSLAARDMRSTDLAQKVADGQQDGGVGTNANADWAEILGVRAHPHIDGGDDLAPEDIVVLVKEAIKNFRNSDADVISLDHVPDPDHPLLEVAARPSRLRREVLAYAREAWQDKTDPVSRELNFHHDDYLKIWALSRPKIHADTIIFDEAQDINPVLRKVVFDNMRPQQGPAAQVVIVGDPNQAIYAFRGAENALEDWPADIELPLNKSWRFGPEVADIANVFLKLLGSSYLMEGNDAVSTPIGPIDTPNAVLGRNNTGVVAAVLAALEEGRAVHMVGGGDELQRMAEGAKELQEKGKTRKHPELVPFRSWQQVQRYVDKHDSAKQLKSFVRLVDEHGADTLIDMVGQLTENADEADLIVSTAHKSKGLEWHLVQIGTDFRGPRTSTEAGQPVELPEDEELRLAYVAATRGMRGLDLGSLQYIEDLRALAEERYTSRGAAVTDGAPSPSPQTSAVPETREEPAAAPAAAATAPASPSEESPRGTAVPESSAFEKLKPREANALAAPDGTLWWGGRTAGRKNPRKNPVLVRLRFGPRGLVDVENAVTGEIIEHTRTGTPFFAAAVPVAEPMAPADVDTQASAVETTEESSPAAPRQPESGDGPHASTEAGSDDVGAPQPAADVPAFQVSDRATAAGRRWAVVDRTTGDIVWIRQRTRRRTQPSSRPRKTPSASAAASPSRPTCASPPPNRQTSRRLQPRRCPAVPARPWLRYWAR